MRAKILLPFLSLMLAVLATAAMADRYAAVAFSPTSGSWGNAWNFTGEDAAKQEAVKRCTQHAKDCEVVGTVRSAENALECLSVVSLQTSGKGPDSIRVAFRRTFTATSPTKEQSEKDARRLCADAAGDASVPANGPCRLVVSVCSRSK